jgi:hypothetical protein
LRRLGPPIQGVERGSSLYPCHPREWYNQGILRGKAIVCSIALIFGGCPKRNTGPRIVYIPSPPPAATPAETASGQSTQAIVIQAPAPPEPEQIAPAPAPAPPPAPQPRRSLRRDEQRRAEETSPEPETPKVPAIEPSESTARESKLHYQVVQMQQQIQQRITQLSREWLSPTERETLAGARGFLQQSLRALQESDLQRASNLAHKAYLLVEAIEQSQ